MVASGFDGCFMRARYQMSLSECSIDDLCKEIQKNTYKSLSYNDYMEFGKRNILIDDKIIKENIDSFIENENIDASKVIDKWFPPVKADIFLSHSHKDYDDVAVLAGILDKEFNIKSFIDASVWGYSETLLRMIDDKYCKFPDRSAYNYDLRNQSTSHVYMMLSIALMKMIDACECVIFIDTPNSIDIKETLSSGKTLSLWIYSEIAMTKMVRLKEMEEERASLAKQRATSESFGVSYQVEFEHLTKLTKAHIKNWISNRTSDSRSNLDNLYRITGL